MVKGWPDRCLGALHDRRPEHWLSLKDALDRPTTENLREVSADGRPFLIGRNQRYDQLIERAQYDLRRAIEGQPPDHGSDFFFGSLPRGDLT